MNHECVACEAEFYVDTTEEVRFCVACGEELEKEDDDFPEDFIDMDPDGGF